MSSEYSHVVTPFRAVASTGDLTSNFTRQNIEEYKKGLQNVKKSKNLNLCQFTFACFYQQDPQFKQTNKFSFMCNNCGVLGHNLLSAGDQVEEHIVECVAITTETMEVLREEAVEINSNKTAVKPEWNR